MPQSSKARSDRDSVQSARAKLARKPKKLPETISPLTELLREAEAGDEHARWRAKELYGIDF